MVVVTMFLPVWEGDRWRKRGVTVSPLKMAATICSCGHARDFFTRLKGQACKIASLINITI